MNFIIVIVGYLFVYAKSGHHRALIPKENKDNWVYVWSNFFLSCFFWQVTILLLVGVFGFSIKPVLFLRDLSRNVRIEELNPTCILLSENLSLWVTSVCRVQPLQFRFFYLGNKIPTQNRSFSICLDKMVICIGKKYWCK